MNFSPFIPNPIQFIFSTFFLSPLSFIIIYPAVDLSLQSICPFLHFAISSKIETSHVHHLFRPPHSFGFVFISSLNLFFRKYSQLCYCLFSCHIVAVVVVTTVANIVVHANNLLFPFSFSSKSSAHPATSTCGKLVWYFLSYEWWWSVWLFCNPKK